MIDFLNVTELCLGLDIVSNTINPNISAVLNMLSGRKFKNKIAGNMFGYC